jgi:hypothetical protein
LEGYGILWPDMRLVKPYQVEKLFRESIAAVRQRFWIRKCPLQRFDDTGFTLNVCWCSEVSRWRAHTDAYLIAWLKFGRHCYLLDAPLADCHRDNQPSALAGLPFFHLPIDLFVRQKAFFDEQCFDGDDPPLIVT